MRILNAEQMREIDRLTTQRFGISTAQLMENAGQRVAEAVAERFPDLAGRRLSVLCGKGNNGGDGLVAARSLLIRGARVMVLLFAAPESLQAAPAENLARWKQAGGELNVVRTPAEWEAARPQVAAAELIVDALLGTGLRGPVEGLLARVIEDVNQLHRADDVLAVDIPSGISSDGAGAAGPAIFAGATVTFAAPKRGFFEAANSEHVGRLLVRGIGNPAELLEAAAPPELRWLEPQEFRGVPLRRRPDTHKGTYGHALIVAGSRGKTGAAVLAGTGALRSGAGLVTVATPANVLSIVAAGAPELMTEPLEGTETDSVSLRCLDYGRYARLLEGKSVLGLGPGLSTHPETQQFVHKAVAECPLPLVLDADGLNAFAGLAARLKQRRSSALAVTPHPGEMARLLGCATSEVQAQRVETALRCAADWNAYVILKGFQTVVASPAGKAFINSTGNPGMATGGTGDVLTGLLTGLTAQFGTDRWETVLGLGVYLHGLAGDVAAAELGGAPLVASDLLRALPRAFARLLGELGRG